MTQPTSYDALAEFRRLWPDGTHGPTAIRSLTFRRVQADPTDDAYADISADVALQLIGAVQHGYLRVDEDNFLVPITDTTTEALAADVVALLTARVRPDLVVPLEDAGCTTYAEYVRVALQDGLRDPLPRSLSDRYREDVRTVVRALQEALT